MYTKNTQAALLCVSLIALPSISIAQTKKPAPLTSPVIHFIDGKSFGIDAQTFGFMLQQHRFLTKMHEGIKKADNKVGVFSFAVVKVGNKTYFACIATDGDANPINRIDIIEYDVGSYTPKLHASLHENDDQKLWRFRDVHIAAFEQATNELQQVATHTEGIDFEFLFKILSSRKPYTFLSLIELEKFYGVTTRMQITRNTHNYEEIGLLRAYLEYLKYDCDSKLSPFVESARGTKTQMVVLIEEYCHNRNRQDSLLRAWADADEGEEQAVFHDQVTNFKELDLFATDLIGFLKDLIESCPKGKKLFLAFIKNLKK